MITEEQEEGIESRLGSKGHYVLEVLIEHAEEELKHNKENIKQVLIWLKEQRT